MKAFATAEAAEHAMNGTWIRLRTEPTPITLDRLHADGLLVMPDGSRPPATRDVPTPSRQIDAFLDAYALYSRLDAVDEAGKPFVPFVRPLTKREMQRFAYGVLLESSERTLLVQHTFGDFRGHAACPTEEADGILTNLSDTTNYTDVLLLQLRSIEITPTPAAPEDGAQQDGDAVPATASPVHQVSVVPCFRLRFRRNTDGSDTFVLASVLVSAHRFTDLHEDLRQHTANAPAVDYYSRLNESNSPALRQRQEAWACWMRLTGGSVLSDPLSGAAPVAKECGYTVPGAGKLEEVDEAVRPEAPAFSAIDCGEDFIPRRCEYSQDRMRSRVAVVQRVPGKQQIQWAALCDQIGIAEGGDASALVAKVIMKDTRNGEDGLEGGELTVHVPSGSSSNAVYSTDSEELLRAWITRALVIAESRGLVQLLFRPDLPTIVSRCCGLLSIRPAESDSADGEVPPLPATYAAREHALRIITETIEDFVQCSGTLWRVIIMTEPPSGDEPYDGWTEAAVAARELDRIGVAKSSTELGQPRAPSPTRGCVRERKPRVLEEDAITTLSPQRRGRRGTSLRMSTNANASAVDTVPTDEIPMAAPLPVPTTYVLSPLPTESDLRRLFKRLDRTNNGYVSRDELRALLLPKDRFAKALGAEPNLTNRGTYVPQRSQESYLSCGTALSPIDECGVPLTEAAVDEYLAKYCRMRPEGVTFQEFCVMMLDIARR